MLKWHNQEFFPFVVIWVAVFLSVIALITFGYFLNEFNFSLQSKEKSFELYRLSKLKNHGVVVVGNSLVRSGFFYDEDMESLALKNNLNIEFVRISLAAGRPNEFEQLLQPILQANPKVVFIQLEPFIFCEKKPLHVTAQESAINVLQYVKEKLGISSRAGFSSQDDVKIRRKLEKRANILLLKRQPSLELCKNNTLSKKYQEFIHKAKEKNISVIFIEINRSSAFNLIMPTDFVSAKNRIIANFSIGYQVEVWSFSSLNLRDYIDGHHLNQYGREKLSLWFIQRLKNERNYQ